MNGRSNTGSGSLSCDRNRHSNLTHADHESRHPAVTWFSSLLGAFIVFSAASALPAATRQLEYELTLAPVVRGEAQAPINQFRVNYLIQPDTDNTRVDYWLSEQQQEGWAWPERYGRQQLSPGRTVLNGNPVKLLHRYEGTPFLIELPTVLFDQQARLGKSDEWQSGQKQYAAGRELTQKGRVVREVEVIGRIGRTHRLQVDIDDGAIVRNEQRVFMGRGDQFVLLMTLVSDRELKSDESARLTSAFDSLLDLQGQLKRRDGETKPELSAEQLTLVDKQLPAIEKLVADTSLKSLVAAAGRDRNQQSRREQSIEDLAGSFVGKAAPEFTVRDLKLKDVESKSLKGKILLLHFWEYQHEPLEEPYGQVGYLDYLNNKRQKLGVKVMGVAVDSRVANPDGVRVALRSVRKLKEFMNLSYDLTVDDGTVLRKFGDPRRVDAKLPLWVVVDPDGKVVYYKAGLYQIRPDQGLKDLDQVLIEQIRKARE